MRSVFCFLITFLIINSCKQKQIVTETNLITEIIIETIKQDSIDTTRTISSKLVDYYLYVQTKDSILGYLPPPPISDKGEPFIFDWYQKDMYSTLGYKTKPEDSLYIVKQVSLFKNIMLDSSRIAGIIKIVNADWRPLDHMGYNIIYFMIPIFNKDKTFARVEYFYRCASCGYGKMLFFKKIENKWYKVESFVTWIT